MEREALLTELRGLAEETLTPFVKGRVEELHEKVFGHRLARTSCSNCYHDAILLMYHHLKKNLPMAKEREFILKRGVVLQPVFGVAKFYTALTITDDVAREYLTKHPEGANLFEKVGKIGSEESPTPVSSPEEGVKAEKVERERKTKTTRRTAKRRARR